MAQLVWIREAEPLSIYQNTVPLAEFLANNSEDPDVQTALPLMLKGETVTIGGGAAFAFTLCIVDDQPDADLL